MLTRKEPRDFVHIDEFWPADAGWESYFVDHKVWVFVDDYRAEIIGDEDYSRIIIHAGNNTGWIFHRRLKDKANVHDTLSVINIPVSEKQLGNLGFTRWQESYL